MLMFIHVYSYIYIYIYLCCYVAWLHPFKVAHGHMFNNNAGVFELYPK